MCDFDLYLGPIYMTPRGRAAKNAAKNVKPCFHTSFKILAKIYIMEAELNAIAVLYLLLPQLT